MPAAVPIARHVAANSVHGRAVAVFLRLSFVVDVIFATVLSVTTNEVM